MEHLKEGLVIDLLHMYCNANVDAHAFAQFVTSHLSPVVILAVYEHEKVVFFF